MIRYRLSRQADKDLDEIATYLGERSPSAAVRVIEALHDPFTVLGRSPLLGTLRDDLRTNLRVFRCKKPADSYLIFYFPLPDGVEISTVIHASRDYLGMFAQGER